MLEFNSFEAIKIGLASPETILSWSHGEVTKPETINYRTLKPEKDGLFCERIFGPTKDWECHCGKYKKIRYKGKICERCGVEVTKSKVRRERMGHITLATPVSHIWYFKGVPSSMGLMLDLSPRQLEKVLYFASYIVTDPGRSRLMQNQVLSEREYREAIEMYGETFTASMGAEAIKTLLERIDLEALSKELKEELEASQGQKKARIIKRLEIVEAFRLSGNRPEWMILTVVPVIPPEIRPMVQLDGGRFATSDLNDLYRRVINRNNRLKRLLELGAPDIIIRNEKRMLQEAVDALINNGRRGRTVTGPGNRPLKSLSDMLKGKQGRFRQNLLGKRVDYSGRSVIVVGPEMKIYQCGLPKEMAIELFKPFVMKELVSRGLAHNIKSAKRMVERTKPEVWDVLEDVIKEHPVMLNRAPTLHRLGIQAFEPRLVEGRALKLHPLVCTAYNADFDGDQMAVHVPLSPEAQSEARFLMLSANNLLKPQDGHPVTVPTQDMILGSYYLTLHREDYGRIIDMIIDNEPKLGLLTDILANEAEENIKIYDEDEPIRSFTSMREALEYLKASPAVLKNETEIHMNPITLVLPSGTVRASAKRVLDAAKRITTKVYTSFDEAMLAYTNHEVTLHERIRVVSHKLIDGEMKSALIDATVGRIIFNNNIPQNIGYIERKTEQDQFKLEVDEVVGKKQLGKIIDKCIRTHGTSDTAEVLDKIKATGYKFSTKSAITVAVTDIQVPEKKKQILADAENEVEKIMQKYRMGLLTNEERYQQVIKIWAAASGKVTDAMMENLGEFNPIFMMADSGARGSTNQIRQLAAMRGLMADTQGRTVEIPIRANFREGLNVLEYFISSHGARKGLTDTALRTADSGYLTRRLVDVSQEVIVHEIDCGTTEGEWVTEITDGKESIEPLKDRIVGRTAMEDVLHPETGEVIVSGGELITDVQADSIIKAGITKVYIRSVLTCKSKTGVCAKCYGTNLATGELVNVGEAVGIIAAQSIGEPGTQLTMRTFHAGGVASGSDITQGLPRVEELFEARKPKGLAIISEIGGRIAVSDTKRKREVIVTNDETGEAKTYTIPYGSSIKVHDGDVIEAGDELTVGSVNPNDILAIKGPHAVQVYITREVQRTYRMQGVDINDKHVEVITRQMLRKVRVEDPGDTDLLIGALVDRFELEEANKKLDDNGGGTHATSSPVLLGITKASLATESFLSAASFQETTKVLTEAAIKGKIDPLVGLKENVIIGKLIPAGTGMSMYKDINITVDGQEIPNEDIH
ncbi:MAG TPA: DNA-directed RNA polymerase subunit beta' [Candidatus Ornithomonoglobus intestinigallinarum]|uniref:DNA-directed RNA polymerase subunit beta' n=1 Tax=Candidatus Ornithomonoglobus intestinigallinarum TaxID=2840894 RepID=A0A9D1KQB8_9FIRM|nr:DNA-directed RNA polymerase subunit beta' [Candidatus Ornithomonoglobus intestinigallinarum]